MKPLCLVGMDVDDVSDIKRRNIDTDQGLCGVTNIDVLHHHFKNAHPDRGCQAVLNTYVLIL